MNAIKISLALTVLALAPAARADPAPIAVGGAPQTPVRVEVQSDRANTTLLRMTRAGGVVAASAYGTVVGSFESYEPVCTAPCEIDADPNGIYRVAGRGVTPSDTFALPHDAPKVGLRVRAGSASARGWGWFSAAFGLTAALTGGSFLLVGSLLEPNANDSLYRSDPGGLKSAQDRASTFRTIGWVSLGAGAALIALGVALISTNGTDVESDRGQTLAKVPLPGKLALGPGGVTF